MTTYNERQEFSDNAHVTAAFDLYPLMFNCEQWQLKVTKATPEQDMKQGIDYFATIKKPYLPDIHFSIQERFRNPFALRYQDVTIRVAGQNGVNAELSALQSDLMLYGIFDSINDRFMKALLIDVPKMKLLIMRGDYKPIMSASNTQFIAIPESDLHRNQCVVWKLS